LVEGTFAFVAGKVAHSGDMKIATPVATMGIRGTTGVVQEQPNAPATITANAGDHTYTFAVVPDIGTGITGVWDCYLTDAQGNIQRDANGNPIVLATISQSGYVTYLTPQGLGQPPLVTTEPATNSQYAFEQEMLQQLFLTLNPANLNGNGNNGSSTTPPPFALPNPIPQLFEDSGKPFTINYTPGGSNPGGTTTYDFVTGPTEPTGPPTVVIWTANNNGPWNVGPDWLGGDQPSSPQEVIIPAYKVTTVGADSAAGLVVQNNPNSPTGVLNIVSGTSFTIYDFIHGNGTVQLNASGSDPTLFIDGAVPLVGGGTINMIGSAGENFILGVPGTGALLINVDYTIEGTGTIGGGDGNLTFQNFGTVNANNGLLTINTGNQFYNDGLVEATAGGTLAIKDSVANAGTVQADGGTATVTLSGATFDNLFSVVAKNGGSITFTNVAVTNEAISTPDPAGGTINANGGTVAFDGGSIANGNLLEATNGGTLQLENITVTNSSAGTATIDATSNLDLISASIIGNTIDNAGTAVVSGGASVLHGDTVTNEGSITVGSGASVTMQGDTLLTNNATGVITATDGGIVTIDLVADQNVNSGQIIAVSGGIVDFNILVQGGSNHGLIQAGAGGTVNFLNTHGGGGGGGGGGPQGGNYGTIEATLGGIVNFDNGGYDNFNLTEADLGGIVNLNSGVKNHAGTVESTDLGSQINISNGNDSENAATMIAENSGVIAFTSVTLENDNGATVEANDGTITYQDGSLTNDGTVKADNNGTIAFSGEPFVQNQSDGVFLANSGGSITFGADGNTGSVNNNGGQILADGGTITFASTLTGVQNTGTIAAGTGGTVIIDGFAGGAGVSNDGGSIEANGTNAVVQLVGATVMDGTLETSGGGVIKAVSGTSTLMNVTIADGSDIKTDLHAILDLSGGGSGVAALIDGTVTFEGAGTFEMDFTSYSIRGGTSNATLLNKGTIEGQGTIGTGDTALPGVLSLNNSGIIEAVGGEFIINTGTRNTATTTNSGTLEALGIGAVLLIDFTNMNNAGGAIAAFNDPSPDLTADNASKVELLDDIIIGGTLKTSNFGTIETITNNGVATSTVFDGVTNDGYVYVTDNTTLILRETITNTNGTVALGFGGNAILELDGTVTVNGGSVQLNGGNDKIVALAPGAILNNASTISGSGQIGAGDDNLRLDNLSGGTIDANISDATLTLNTGANEITNCGTLEATCGGTLTIDSSLDNYGMVTASHGGNIQIDGNVRNESSGQIGASCGGSITFSDDCVFNASNASIGTMAGGTVTFDGSHIVNCGLIGADGGIVTIEDSCVQNFGALVDGVLNGIGAENGGIVTIECSNVVSTGIIGAQDGGSICIDYSCINNSGGTLDDGNGISAYDGGSITIKDSFVTNTGFIRAFVPLGDDSTGGTIAIDNSTVHNAGGTISALGKGSVVDLCNATIDGGTLATDDTAGGTLGLITIVSPGDGSNTTVFNGVDSAVTIDAFVKVDAGAALDLVGQIDNNGTIDVDCGPTGADLVIDGTVALCGSGVVTLDGSGDEITGICDGTLKNFSSIIGSGQIGTGDTSLKLVNEACGLINADSADGCLVIDTGCIAICNFGTMEATWGGTLVLRSDVDNGHCGIIQAVGCDATVVLDQITISGGTLETSCGGLIQVVCGDTTLECSSIACGTDVQIDNGARLTLDNDCVTGTTFHDACDAVLAVDGDTTLRLSGVTVHGGTIDDYSTDPWGCIIAGNIDVTGDSTFNDVTLNHGVVTVEDGVSLALQGTIVNNSTINVDEEVSGANLVIDGCVTLDGCGVVILGGSSDAIVGGASGGTLHNDSGISGTGTIGGDCLILVNEADGVINADVCGTTLDINTGHSVSNAGLMEVTNNATLQIDDDVCNSGLLGASCGGTIDVMACSITWTGDTATAGSNGIALDHGTLLVDSDSLTLDGGGEVALDCGVIAAASCGDTLYNADTITGTGAIGCGGLVLINEACGVINANSDGGTLTLDTGCNTIVNCGTLEASCGGTLDIKSVVDNGGMLVAQSGGLLHVEDCISGGCALIQGGTLQFDKASDVNVTFCNGDSGTDYGTLVLGDAAHFSGQIYGFDGTSGGSCNSDTVELTGFCETSYCVQHCDGNEILTLYDGDRSVTLTFDDFNQCFKIEDVGGNTYIYDPPAAVAKDAGFPVTTASAGDSAATPADQNGSGTDHATGPANETAFGGDQLSAVTLSLDNGSDATPVTNQLAPPSGTLAPDSGQPAGSTIEAAFGGDHAAVLPATGATDGNSSEADAGTLTNGLNGGFTPSLLLSLLNTLTGDDAVASNDTSASGGDHGVGPAIVDGSSAANSEVAPSTVPANEHAVVPTLATSPAPATSPTLASVSFSILSNDNFAFHPNLGSDTAQNTSGTTNELAHNNIQIVAPALVSMAPEFHQDFAFDAIHQDAANIAASVDHFHQMAASSTLLH